MIHINLIAAVFCFVGSLVPLGCGFYAMKRGPLWLVLINFVFFGLVVMGGAWNLTFWVTP